MFMYTSDLVLGDGGKLGDGLPHALDLVAPPVHVQPLPVVAVRPVPVRGAV